MFCSTNTIKCCITNQYRYVFGDSDRAEISRSLKKYTQVYFAKMRWIFRGKFDLGIGVSLSRKVSYKILSVFSHQSTSVICNDSMGSL